MNPAAYAVLNTAAITHNLQKVRELAPNSKIMAVIKANGYGHGALRVANALEHHADGFAVARVDEGARLRKAGIKKRIAVLGGFTCAEELEKLLAYHLDVVVHSSHQLAIFAERNEQESIEVWLKCDTGMNRLGFKTEELPAVYQQLKQCKVIKSPIRFMTHLARADEPECDMTLKQIHLFHDTLKQLNLQNKAECSIANSAGILAWRDTLADWVRPGVMLYGISPFANNTGKDLGLNPIMSLHSRLISVKPIYKGDTVGYGASWQCEKDTLLGVVAIGYADGYPRYAKAGTPVLVNNQRVPLIGRVSMDMITVDLSSQPTAKAGDIVTLWDEDLPVEEIALCANTIPYTLVCGVTQRVRQIEAE
ncbi:alanine racemase [uncultured bacterium]|nr:alanine racemase [uncultured bacterium]